MVSSKKTDVGVKRAWECWLCNCVKMSLNIGDVVLVKSWEVAHLGGLLPDAKHVWWAKVRRITKSWIDVQKLRGKRVEMPEKQQIQSTPVMLEVERKCTRIIIESREVLGAREIWSTRKSKSLVVVRTTPEEVENGVVVDAIC